MPGTTPDVAATEPVDASSPPRAVSRAHHEVVGDRALERATGQPRAHWYALLDAAGAAGWRHRDIATWLAREHGVDPWWCQGLTVGYEQARGIRVPGQRQDGTFECSVSRVVPADRERAWELVTEPELRGRWLDADARVTGRTPPASVRWALPDGTRAVVRVEPVRPGATRVVVQHARLPAAEAVPASRAVWKDRLARLAELAAGTCARTGAGPA